MFNFSNSKVTMELREVLATKDENGNPFNLWDFDYPSYYEGDEKTAFEQKVIDHFLFHQIGSETIGRFKHNFKTKIREIMPYYMQMYKSVAIMDKIEDPFGNVDVTETFTQTSTDTTTGSSSNTEIGSANGKTDTSNTDTRKGSNARDHRLLNTPQGRIENLDDGYLTEATKDNDTSNETITGEGETNTESSSSITNEGTSETTATGTVTHTFKKTGNQGVNTYAHDMIEYRQSFINVDMMIIGELRDLFLLIY